MGKGMAPKRGYNDKLYHKNYDGIDWNTKPKVRKTKTGLMNSSTKVHEDKRNKIKDTEQKDEIKRYFQD
jgi:hypothetical protein